MSVCLDITEKVGYEGELKMHIDKLRRLDDMNNHLVHTVSHELKGPLATVQGLLQLFKEGKLSIEEMQEVAINVERDIEYARGLLTKLENMTV